MNEQEQYDQINYPSFFGAVGDKITAAKTAMDAIPAEPDNQGWLETNVNNVPVLWHYEGSDCRVRVGRKASGDPFYEILIPYQWLAA